MKQIDARGLACPAPVLQTKEMLEAESINTIDVIVDNEAARQNITRFLESQNFSTTVTLEGNDFHILGKKDGVTLSEKKEIKPVKPQNHKLMIMCLKFMGNLLAISAITAYNYMILHFFNCFSSITPEKKFQLTFKKVCRDSGKCICICGETENDQEHSKDFSFNSFWN